MTGRSPASLLLGVDAAVSGALGIANVRHRSALHRLRIPASVDIAAIVHRVIAANWIAGRASENKDRSRQNWRWTLQPQISGANRSPEVILERAIASACAAAGRSDWANQIPVSSGLIKGASDGRRAADLARRKNDGAYELIELKIASDTPLYAAVELLGYASLWLLARTDPPATNPALLAAKRLDLRVLAPAPFYSSFKLESLERVIDDGARSLVKAESVQLSFCFDVLPTAIAATSPPSGETLLSELAGRHRLHSR